MYTEPVVVPTLKLDTPSVLLSLELMIKISYVSTICNKQHIYVLYCMCFSTFNHDVTKDLCRQKLMHMKSQFSFQLLFLITSNASCHQIVCSHSCSISLCITQNIYTITTVLYGTNLCQKTSLFLSEKCKPRSIAVLCFRL